MLSQGCVCSAAFSSLRVNQKSKCVFLTTRKLEVAFIHDKHLNCQWLEATSPKTMKSRIVKVETPKNFLFLSDLWTVRTVFGASGKMFAEAAFTTVFLYTTELYPTVMRSENISPVFV